MLLSTLLSVCLSPVAHTDLVARTVDTVCSLSESATLFSGRPSSTAPCHSVARGDGGGGAYVLNQLEAIHLLLLLIGY